MNTFIVVLRVVFAVVFIGLSAQTAHADEHYTFDKTHTSIRFSVSNFGLSEVTGAFAGYDGDFVFCVGHPKKDEISIILYAADIHTPDGERDEELQGPHFFNAAQFPYIYFSSNKVKFINKNDAKVEGDLTLLGVTKPMTLHVHFLKKDSDPDSDDYVSNFSAFGVIKRSDFGMDYLTPVVGNEVRLRIEARGVEDNKPHD